MTAMTATTTRIDNGCLLIVAGEVDCANAGELYAVALGAFEDPAVHAVIVDLAGLSFCDAAALGSFVRIRNASLERDKALTLRSLSTGVARLFRLTELDAAFTIAPAPDSTHSHSASRRGQK